MRDLIAVSAKVAESLKIAESAISGEFFKIYSASQKVKAADIASFRVKATEIAKRAISEAAKDLISTSSSVASEAASRAYLDVTKERKEFDVKVNCNSVLKGISTMFIQFIVDGENILRQYSTRVAINTLSGWQDDKAISFGKKNVEKMVTGWSSGKTRLSRFPLHHSVFLMIAGRITSASHMSYIEKAASLGVKTFKIVQEGHKRNGLTFGCENVPTDELHPQSRAYVVAMGV